MSHSKKIWERFLEARLGRVMISELQYSFMPRKSMTDVMFALSVGSMEKVRRM